MPRAAYTAVAVTLTVALSLVACSTKGGGSSEVKTDKSGIKTDYGVTADTITLGALPDLSGVFKAQGIAYTAGNEIWANEVNASGGICGRQIKLEIKDMQYQADKAVTLYAAMKNDVAGVLQLDGSPPLAALKQSLVSDNMLTVPASWASTNLDAKQVLMVGATYDIEVLNGLDYLQKQGLIKDGDTLGHIYIDSEYGKGALLGSQAYAKDHQQTVVPVAVTASDNDMTPAITQLKSQGVSTVIVTTTYTQMSSAATAMAAQGISNVPLLGNNPTFDPTLLATPAAGSMGNYYRVASFAPFAADKPVTQSIAKAYESKYTD